MVDDDLRLTPAAAMDLKDENARLREIVNHEPTKWAAIAAMLYEMIVVKGMREEYAIENCQRVVRAANRVRF